jgi:ferredoxin--NADP+ reductase
MLRDPDTWTRFKRIILLHGVRHATELGYRDELVALTQRAVDSKAQFIYLPVTSQEPLSCDASPSIQSRWLTAARLTTLLDSGELEQRVGLALEPARSRIMLCGNPAMVTEMRARLSERGFAPGRRGASGNLAVENYW